MSNKPLRLLVLSILLLVVAFPVFAQEEGAVLVSSVGMGDTDGSVLYSVLVESGEGDLQTLTISSTIPKSATYADVFWTPESAVYAGEENGIVTWTLDALPAHTVIGPFTYRVRFEDGATIPYRAQAAVAMRGEVTESATDDRALPVFSSSGSITIDPSGTAGIAAVGDTGVFMFVPAGAYDIPVTYSLERLPITDDTPLPTIAEDTWWCTLFSVSIEPADVVASTPVVIFYPTRRTLTPDMPAFGFIQAQGEEWEALAPDAAKAEALWAKLRQVNANIASAVISPSGNQIMVIAVNHAMSNFNFAGGVNTGTRASGISDGTSNMASLLQNVNIVDGTSNIVDGTSNTNVSILKQDARIGR